MSATRKGEAVETRLGPALWFVSGPNCESLETPSD